MTLLKKEYRELAPMVIASAVLLIASGWVLEATREPARYLVQGLAIVRFIAGFCICSILGAVLFAGDREQGTDEFLSALPLTRDRIFGIKSMAGLSGTVLLVVTTCLANPSGTTVRWWSLMLLAYAIGQFWGIALGHSVNASALSTAVSLAIFCGVIGSPYINRHYIPATLVILSVAAGLIVIAGGLHRRIRS